MPVMMYSALDVVAVDTWAPDAVAVPAVPEVITEPTELGGTVVSTSAPSSSRRISRNSIAASLIDWYRSSGSFARQRRTIRVKSAGAAGFASFTRGRGA